MICPNCDHDQELTWKMYFRSGFGYHNCPCCKKRYKVVYNFFHIFELTILGLIIAVPGAFLGYYFGFNLNEISTSLIVLLLMILLPLNKAHDNKKAEIKLVDDD